MASHFGVEDPQLPQAIGELRILWCSAALPDGSIEPPKDLLESVVVALTVAARQIGKSARRRLQQRGILDEDLVAVVAVT